MIFFNSNAAALTRVLTRAFLIGMLASWFPAQAQDWPAKPIRIVVPYPAGGASDTLGRQLADKLSLQWGQPVIIDNRPGSSSIAGAVAVARSPADGYTLLLAPDATMSINPHLFAKLPYNAEKDFIPVAMVALLQQVLVVPTSLPANNLAELIALARAKPGALNYGSQGVGNLSHLSMEMLKANAKIHVTHIPFKGGADSVVAVASGQVQMLLVTISTVQPHIKSGRLKALAISGTQRSPLLPDVPTFAELGYPDAGAVSYFALFFPADVPNTVVTRVASDVAQIVVDPEFRAKADARGFNPPTTSNPQEFAAFLKQYDALAAKAVKISGAKVE